MACLLFSEISMKAAQQWLGRDGGGLPFFFVNTLCTIRHMVNQDLVAENQFHKFAVRQINPPPPTPSLYNLHFGKGPQSLEVHGGRLLASLETPMSASAEQRESR